MSIEKDLSRIAAALETIAAKIGTVPAEHAPVTIPYTPPAPPAPVTPVPAPVPAVPVVEPAPAPVQVTTVTAPFTDAKGMLQYVMDAYKSMGPEKGAKIQGVLASLGCQNINDVQVGQYAALFAGIEALK